MPLGHNCNWGLRLKWRNTADRKNADDEISTPLALLIVLWQAGVWVIGFIAYLLLRLIAYLLLRLKGCNISARGPEECLIWGADFGEYIYPLWSLGFYLMGTFLWVPIGLILLGLLRAIKRTS